MILIVPMIFGLSLLSLQKTGLPLTPPIATPSMANCSRWGKVLLKAPEKKLGVRILWSTTCG